MRKLWIKIMTIVLCTAICLSALGICTAEKTETSTAPWTCLNCGQENTTRFCQECGAEKPYWICSCGRINSSNKFCGDCGKSLAEQLEAANKTLEDAAQQQYTEAIAGLEALGDFDSGSFETSAGLHTEAKTYICKLYYEQGLLLQAENGSHDEIIACFEKASNYADAAEQIDGENARYRRSLYDAGAEYLKNGEYEEAVAAFIAAGDYLDAKEQISAAYYAQGQYLLEGKAYEQARTAFENAGEYAGAKEKIRETYYLQGIEAADAGKTEESKDFLKKAGDYPGAKEHLKTIAADEKAQTYSAATEAMDRQDYKKAESLFKSLGSYSDSKKRAVEAQTAGFQQELDRINTDPETMNSDNYKNLEYLRDKIVKTLKDGEENELAKQVSYLMGQYNLQKNYYWSAIGCFQKAGDYRDASSLAIDSTIAAIRSHLESGKTADAINLYTRYDVGTTAPDRMDELVVAQAGSHSETIREILALVKCAGIRNDIPDWENTYREEYIPAIKALQEHFGFEGDEKITLQEYMAFNDAIYPGCSSYRVGRLLEKLSDLSFLGKLPADHDTYEAKYKGSIRKAENQLCLLADGIVTKAEYDEIMAQKVEKPTAPANIKAKVSGDTVTLSWSAVPGALSYKVYVYEGAKSSDSASSSLLKLQAIRGDPVGTTKKTSLTITDVDTEKTYIYYVRAEKYTTSGETGGVKVEVPRYFKPVTAKELNQGGPSFAEKYVKLTNLRIAGWAVQDESGCWYQKEEDARIAQNHEGYDLYLLGYSGSDYVEIVMKNYSRWDWDKGDQGPLSLVCKGKLKSITVEAQVQDGVGSWDKAGIVPTVVASRIWWR